MADTNTDDSGKINWLLCGGAIVSIVWLFMAAIYVVRTWDEFVKLPANSVGDTLAGIFAPLAFLWLVIATLLQRRELELQRLEFKDARHVYAQQRDELANSAKQAERSALAVEQSNEINLEKMVFDHYVVMFEVLLINLICDSDKYYFIIDHGSNHCNYEYIFQMEEGAFDDQNYVKLIRRIDSKALRALNILKNQYNLVRKPDSFEEKIDNLNNLINNLINFSHNKITESYCNSVKINQSLNNILILFQEIKNLPIYKPS